MILEAALEVRFLPSPTLSLLQGLGLSLLLVFQNGSPGLSGTRKGSAGTVAVLQDVFALRSSEASDVVLSHMARVSPDIFMLPSVFPQGP